MMMTRKRMYLALVSVSVALALFFAYKYSLAQKAISAAAHAARKTVRQEKPLAHVEGGFIDKTGTLAIKVPGRFHGKFSDGLARVWMPVKGNNGETDKWGYIDATGRVAIQPTYDWALPFSDGLAAVNVGGQASDVVFVHGLDVVWAKIGGGKWLFIDKKGKVLIETPYTEVRSFRDGLAPIRTEDKWGYIDKAGKIVVPPQFEDAEELHDGMGAVLLGHKWGFIDKSGKQVVEPKYSSRIELIGGQIVLGVGFSNGLAWVDNGQPRRKGKKWGVIDSSGQFVIEPEYDDYGSDFSEGLSSVKIKGKQCVIDKSGKVTYETDYDVISEFSEGIASFSRGHKFGAIDKSGKVVIEPQFHNWLVFSQGLPAAETEEFGNTGYIDNSGTWVIHPQAFGEAWEFQKVSF